MACKMATLISLYLPHDKNELNEVNARSVRTGLTEPIPKIRNTKEVPWEQVGSSESQQNSCTRTRIYTHTHTHTYTYTITHTQTHARKTDIRYRTFRVYPPRHKIH